MVSHNKYQNKRGWILYELAVSIAILSFMTISIISMIGCIEMLFQQQKMIIHRTELTHEKQKKEGVKPY